MRAQQSATSAFHRRLVAETDALARDADALRSAAAALDARARGTAANSDADSSAAPLASAAARDAARMLAAPDVNAFLPRRRQSFFMQLFLGSEVDVCSPRQDARLRLKEEYNQYRNWTSMLYIFFPSLLAGLQHSGVAPRSVLGLMTTLYHAWLLHFYSALALRESVLLANGSHIRLWWIRHHYYFIGLSLVMLTCSYANAPCRAFMQRFNIWAAFQGVVMILQTKYQRKRMYTRVALGRDGSMDVVAADGSGVRGQVLLLIPLLWVLQIAKLWMGLSLLYEQALAAYSASVSGATLGEQFMHLFSHPDDVDSPAIVPGSGQLWMCGIIITVIALGNLHATSVTLYHKFAKPKERRTASIARDLAKLE